MTRECGLTYRSTAPKEAGLELSVLIPCHNEAEVIEATVNDLLLTLRPSGVRFEILAVNNASTDRTEQVLQSLAEKNDEVRYVNTPANPGYGVAVRWGLEFFRGDCVAIVMADGSESPADVVALVRTIQEGFDCAFGTRFTPEATLNDYPPIKLLLNRLGNRLIAWMTGVDYNDYTNGFKCFRREMIEAMQPLYAEQFNLTIEMSVSAVLGGARFAVVPNSWRDRSGGASKFRILEQAKLYLLTLAYCWLRARLQGKTWKPFREALRGEPGVRIAPRSSAGPSSREDDERSPRSQRR